MSSKREHRARVLRWYQQNRPSIDRWLADNPPPHEWRGSRLEWAYCEMPDPETLIGRALLRMGL